MAIPSGSGTEVLKRHYVHALSNTETALITGVANHIYTVLSVVWTELGDATEAVHMYIGHDAGATDIYLMSSQSITSEQTFVWNDKFVLTGTDILYTRTANASNVDVWITYIDQDWS